MGEEDSAMLKLFFVGRRNREVLQAISQLGSDIMAMFDDLGARVRGLTDAADAMDAVLVEVKSKLDEVLANSNLTPADAAALQAISDAIDAEKDKIVADTLANTPAAP